MRLPSAFRGAAFRFSLLHTLIFVVIVGLIGVTTEAMTTRSLERQALDRVEGEAATLADDFAHEGLAGLRDAIEPRVRARATRLRYAIIDADRRTVGGDPDLAPLAGPPGTSQAAALRTVPGDPTDTVAVASRALSDGSHIVVVDDLESVEDVQNVVWGAFALAFGLAVVLGLGAGAFLTNALLQRVEAITRTADAIIGGDLGRRIALKGTGDDFDRLSATLNTMLDRIAGLMDNVRQVTGDLAHDLRTPLSRLRQGLEDVRHRARSSADYERAVDRAIKEADGLLDIFSAILRIAEVEGEARRAAFRPVDLSDLVTRVADAYAPVVEDEGRSFAVEVQPGIVVEGDPELLPQMLSNLIENALTHTPRGTALGVALRHEPVGAGVIVEVWDEGPGIPADEREKIFRRFYRLERSRTSPGNGLGLSLVAAVADLHHGSCKARDNRPGLRIVVALDAGPRPAASGD